MRVGVGQAAARSGPRLLTGRADSQGDRTPNAAPSASTNALPDSRVHGLTVYISCPNPPDAASGCALLPDPARRSRTPVRRAVGPRRAARSAHPVRRLGLISGGPPGQLDQREVVCAQARGSVSPRPCMRSRSCRPAGGVPAAVRRLDDHRRSSGGCRTRTRRSRWPPPVRHSARPTEEPAFARDEHEVAVQTTTAGSGRSPRGGRRGGGRRPRRPAQPGQRRRGPTAAGRPDAGRTGGRRRAPRPGPGRPGVSARPPG